MAALTTLANVKSWCGPSSSTADDGLLTRLIAAASQFVINYTGQNFLAGSYDEWYNGHGGVVLALRQRPITAVTVVNVDGIAIPEADNATEGGFRFDDAFVYLNGYRFARGNLNVNVQYSAGAAEAPVDIQRVVDELVGLKYREKPRIGENSKSVNGETVSFETRELPPHLKLVLDHARSRVPA